MVEWDPMLRPVPVGRLASDVAQRSSQILLGIPERVKENQRDGWILM
jgi:hypothetical protein